MRTCNPLLSRRVRATARLASGVALALVSASAAAQTPPAAGAPPVTPPPAAAAGEEPRKLYAYMDWQTLASGTGPGVVCYVTHLPTAVQSANRRDGRPMIVVAHRPAKGAFDVVTYFAGYRLKAASDVELDFGVVKYRLFADDERDAAWAGAPDLDARIVETLKAGMTVAARGVDEQGGEIVDTFSLQGFTAAHNRAGQECKAR
ncbi:MAG: hypothetical protein IPK81_17690 [Rhodospirillales bacterium]|nr:MAG: hypothetical protein IPK81_17690 [Rhodospirillales bacterium]